MDLTVLIPCYNESANVPDIHRRLLPVATELAADRTVEILFVDDGSTDGTYDALRQAFGRSESGNVEVHIERHPVNRGLGAALRTGAAAARGKIIVSTDSDGTYDFSEIPRLLSHLSPELDVVTASAFHPKGDVIGVAARRILLSRAASTLYRALVSPRLHTYTCLFRAYRREVFEEVAWESDDFLAVTEVLVRAMLMGYAATEAPAILHARSQGVSKARVAPTVAAHLRFLLRIVLHRLHLLPLVEPRRTKPKHRPA